MTVLERAAEGLELVIAATLSPASVAVLASATLARRAVTVAAGIVPAVPHLASSPSRSASEVVTRKVNVTLLPLPALSVMFSSQVCLPSESLDASSGSG